MINKKNPPNVKIKHKNSALQTELTKNVKTSLKLLINLNLWVMYIYLPLSGLNIFCGSDVQLNKLKSRDICEDIILGSAV